MSDEVAPQRRYNDPINMEGIAAFYAKWKPILWAVGVAGVFIVGKLGGQMVWTDDRIAAVEQDVLDIKIYLNQRSKVLNSMQLDVRTLGRIICATSSGNGNDQRVITSNCIEMLNRPLVLLPELDLGDIRR